MEIVPLDKIIVGDNRQRRVFKPQRLQDLASSISRVGLLHPIVVDSFENFRLIAGERRLRALQLLNGSPYMCNGEMIPTGHAAVTQFADLDKARQYEAELEENIQRDDLTWQEKVDAISRLHKLRASQKAESGEKQTFTATAQEIKGDAEVNAHEITEIRYATLLQDFLDDPAVAKASNQREALAIVRKRLTQEFHEKLAKNFDASKASTPHVLHHGNLVEVFPLIGDKTIDVIITDPPYGINAHLMSPMSKSNSGLAHEYNDTFEYAYTIWQEIFTQGARVCKDLAHLYMFYDHRHEGAIRELAKACGWDTCPYPIIWHKPGGGNLGDSTRWPRRSYETILFARRGDKRVTGVYLDCIVKPAADTTIHAAAKPVDVYVDLLRRSTIPGDKVLDPCAGGGTVFPAANKLRLVATGIEVASVHYAAALQRLREE